MVDQYSIAGFEFFAASVALIAVAPTIRYVALEGEIMRHFRNPSPHFAPLLEMMRIRARYLLKAMIGLFASFFIFLFCSTLIDLMPISVAPLEAALRTLAAGFSGYAAVQMFLEIRLTLIGFTYQGVSNSGHG